MTEPDPQQGVLRWIEQYSATMLQDDLLAELAGELINELIVEVPETAADADTRGALDLSTHELLRTMLGETSKDPTAEIAFPPAAVDFARTLARRGHDVGLLLRLYRVGQRVFWSRMMAVVSQEISDPDLRMGVLEFLWDRMSRALERNIDLLVAAHTEESEQRLRGALARRSETVHAILRGDAVDIDNASTQLRHNVRRNQIGLVLWATESAAEPDPAEKLERLAAEIAAVIGAPTPLTIRAGAEVVWAWLATGAEPALARIADAATFRESPALRVAVGIPAPGLAGFRGSHREAVRAQDVAIRAERDAAVTHYLDVEVVSCLSSDQEAMRALVVRELAGLAGGGAALTRLRETALAYLAVGGSARTAADALGVHKNTVLYRLKQAENLLGHGIDERRLELELALKVADVYGERVLPTADIP